MHINKQKVQLQEMKTTVDKYKGSYHPKLKETIKYQKDLEKHLAEIVRDSELLPAMFRMEANNRKNQQK